MTSLVELNASKTQEIKNIAKPLSAYQYYTKAMLEKWGSMSENEKKRFTDQANQDTERYNNEKRIIEERSEEEIKKRNIFLIRSYGRVPCIGLDNGFISYQVIGPVTQVEIFTEKEKQKLIERGIKPESIGEYKSIGGFNFNWRAAKKYNVKVYGGNTNDGDTWWGFRKNYTGKTGQFTSYNNYKGETWTVDH